MGLTKRIPELDGIRGLAILLVIIWHYFVSPSDTVPGSPLSYILTSLRLTWSGVDLFFVLSGFLIGGILMDSKDSPRYFKTFYARRFYRILPLYFACTIIFTASSYFLHTGDAYNWLFQNFPPALFLLTFTQNFWMAGRDDFGALSLAPTWSLAVEEQFYLTLPLLIRYTSRRRLVQILIGILILAPVLRTIFFHYHNWMGAYVLMPMRADSLAVGILIAVLIRSETWKWIQDHRRTLYALLAIPLSYVALLTLKKKGIDSPAVGIFGYSALALTYGIILTLALTGGLVGWIFRIKWLRWLGTIAYGTYLLHMFIFGLCFLLIKGDVPHLSTSSDIYITLLALALTIIIARGSWEYFEKPLVKRGHQYRY